MTFYIKLVKRFFNPNITTLDRYLLREMAGPFFLAVGGFAIIAVVDILFYLVELFVISNISFFTLIRLLVYKLPSIMVLFFPMSVLFAVMLLLVRMAKDNELTILRSSGIHSFRFLAPIILVSFIVSICSYFINELIVPWTNEASNTIIEKEIKKQPPPDMVEQIVFKDQGERFFYIKSIDRNKTLMKDILIFEDSSHFPRILTAKEATWDKNKWTLSGGTILELGEEGSIEFIDHFSELTIHTSQEVESFFTKQKTAKEMDSRELKEKINVLEKGGISTRALKVEYYMKISIPIACFIFGLMGIVFCISFVRSGKDWWGVITSICVAILTVGFYFFIVALFRALGKDGHILPFLSAWIPNLVYGLISGAGILYFCFFR